MNDIYFADKKSTKLKKMTNFSGLKGPSFLPELEGPGKIQLLPDKPDEDDDPNRRIIVTFGNRHAIRYDLEDNSVVAGYYCPTFLTLSTPVAFDSSINSYVCGVNSGKQLIIWDGVEIKLENIMNPEMSRENEQEMEPAKKGKLITLEKDKIAVGIVSLRSVLRGNESPGCYVVFRNGELQTVKHLMDNVNCEKETTEKDSSNYEHILPNTAVRLETSLFTTGENGNLIYVAHAYSLDKKSYVRVCRLALDSETGKSRQTVLHTTQLTDAGSAPENLASSKKANLVDSSVLCLTSFGNFVTYVTANGELIFLDILNDGSKKTLECLKKPSTSIDFSAVNLVPDKDQTINLMALDERRIALAGPREDGEGYTIVVFDAIFDAVIACSKIKTVHAEKSIKQGDQYNVSYLMVCHRGERIFFKHGSKVANVILSKELPCNLSGFIGHEANLDIIPPESKKESSNMEVDSTSTLEIPKWETVINTDDAEEIQGEASQTIELYRKMPEILAKKDFNRVGKILDTYTDIPELLLLNIIEGLILEIFKNADDSKSNKDKSYHKNVVKAFNVPITEVLMTQHLRQCNFELAKNMLMWLVIEMKSENSEKEKVSMDQLLLWVGLIINSHYTNFILSKGNEEIRDLIIITMEFVSELQSTMDVLSSTLPVTKMIRNASKDTSSSSACSSAAVMGLMRSSSINNLSNMANRAYSIELVEF